MCLRGTQLCMYLWYVTVSHLEEMIGVVKSPYWSFRLLKMMSNCVSSTVMGRFIRHSPKGDWEFWDADQLWISKRPKKSWGLWYSLFRYFFICGLRRYISRLFRPVVQSSRCQSQPFDPLTIFLFSRNSVSICTSIKVTSGHMSQGRSPKVKVTRGDKLVNFGHFFAFSRTPPAFLIRQG